MPGKTNPFMASSINAEFIECAVAFPMSNQCDSLGAPMIASAHTLCQCIVTGPFSVAMAQYL